MVIRQKGEGAASVLSFLSPAPQGQRKKRKHRTVIAQNRTSFREYNIEVKLRYFEAHRLVQVQEMYKLPSKKGEADLSASP